MNEKDKLVEYIIKCCYWYYVKAEPLISDPEFDMLFKKLQHLEELYGSTPDSPTQRIYGDLASHYGDVDTSIGLPKALLRKIKFSTVKLVLSWRCNLDCSYCSNKLQHIKNSFAPISQDQLVHLPYKDFELTGGEITLPQEFSNLTEILSNWLPKDRNYYVYSNGVLLNEWHAELLKVRGVGGINVGVHIGEVYDWNFRTKLDSLAWDRLKRVHDIIPIRLWVKEDEVQNFMYDLPFRLKTWKLGDCDIVNTDRFYLSCK